MPKVASSVDSVARIADAWDGIGNYILMPPLEHQGVVGVAGLPQHVATLRWEQLSPEQRRKIAYALYRIRTRMAPMIEYCFDWGGEAS